MTWRCTADGRVLEAKMGETDRRDLTQFYNELDDIAGEVSVPRTVDRYRDLCKRLGACSMPVTAPRGTGNLVNAEALHKRVEQRLLLEEQRRIADSTETSARAAEFSAQAAAASSRAAARGQKISLGAMIAALVAAAATIVLAATSLKGCERSARSTDAPSETHRPENAVLPQD
jgi:hypothetical protein